MVTVYAWVYTSLRLRFLMVGASPMQPDVFNSIVAFFMFRMISLLLPQYKIEVDISRQRFSYAEFDCMKAKLFRALKITYNLRPKRENFQLLGC